MTRLASRLLVVLALLAPLALAGRASADVVVERHPYNMGGNDLLGWFMFDEDVTGRRPCVILFHEWWGCDDFARAQGRRLAELGYVVFVADMYGTDENGNNIVATKPEDAQFYASRLYRDRQLMRQFATAAYLQVATSGLVDPARIGTLGYGFGGTTALELARGGTRLAATVSVHGGLANADQDAVSQMRGETLICNGVLDPYVSAEERDQFRVQMSLAGKPFTFIDYSNAYHAFANPATDDLNLQGMAYDERAAAASWEHIKAFYQRVLGGPTVSTNARVIDERD